MSKAEKQLEEGRKWRPGEKDDCLQYLRAAKIEWNHEEEFTYSVFMAAGKVDDYYRKQAKLGILMRCPEDMTWLRGENGEN